MSTDFELDQQFRSAISHALLGYNGIITKKDWNTVFSECVKISQEAIRQALLPYNWIEIKEGCELPEIGEQIEVFGFPGSMSNSPKVFLSERIEVKDQSHRPPIVDKNGFYGHDVTHWRRIIPPESINSINK